MKAIRIENPGPEGTLKLSEEPMPVPEEGEALIKVHYAGVNRADLFQKQGTYPPPPGASALPGLEVSGEIIEIKATSHQSPATFNVGDRVCALLEGGGYAEYCTAPLGQILPIPDGLSLKEAAALPEACFTVWLSLAERGHFIAGESVLIHGGASGVGVIAIQMMRALCAGRIFATAGTPEKAGLCVRLGAEAVSYQTQDFVEIIKQKTDGKGVDLILDIAGGDYFDRNLKSLAENGRMVIISLLRGPKTVASLGPLLLKRLTVTGSTLRSRNPAEKQDIRDKLQQIIWPALAKKAILPIIDSCFPLAEAEKAHFRMQQNLNLGKIVLEVHP